MKYLLKGGKKKKGGTEDCIRWFVLLPIYYFVVKYWSLHTKYNIKATNWVQNQKEKKKLIVSISTTTTIICTSSVVALVVMATKIPELARVINLSATKNSGKYDCLARNFFLFRSSHLFVILIIEHHLSNTINLIQIRLNRGIHIHMLHIIGLHKK